MTAPVWTLSVDLQTKTAVFQSGLADAAKSARGSFNDIKTSAGEMGRSMGGSMRESREGLRLLGEEFGVHLPRGVISFVSSLGPVAGAMEAAFPFLAIAVAATLFIEHLRKAREEAEKLKDSQINFGTVIENVYTGLDNKLLEAGIRADELNNDHLAALNKQLTLIDHQSLAELVHSFDEMGKAADLTFAQLKTSWYQFGSGSEGAKHALTDFKAQYDSLLAQGKNTEASDLLAGTRKSAEKVLELQKQAIANQFQTGKTGQHTDYSKFEAASNELKKQGVGFTDKEITAQQTLVDALRAQVDVEGKVQALKQAQDKNAKTETNNKVSGDEDKLYRALDQRAKAEQEFYARTHKAQQEAGKKAIETAYELAMEAQRATEDVNKLGMEQFHATQAVTLAAYIASKNEQKNALEEQHRLGLVSEQEYATQLKTIYAEEHEAQKSYLELQADRTSDPDKKLQLQRQLTEETQKYNTALSATDSALRQYTSSWSDYFAKVDASQRQLGRDMRVELQNSISTVTTGFSTGFAKMIVEGKSLGANMQQVAGQIAEHWIESLMKQMIAHEMTVAQHIVGNATMAASDKTTGAMSQLAAAKTGAAKAFQAMAGIPIVGPALGAVAAVGAFSLMMAFEKGGIVPGVTVGDTVPAMLTPGEAVLPKTLTEHLTNAAKFGKTRDSGADVHFHHAPNYHIHAIDGASVKGMLEKHADTFQAHFHSQVRRMNKR